MSGRGIAVGACGLLLALLWAASLLYQAFRIAMIPKSLVYIQPDLSPFLILDLSSFLHLAVTGLLVVPMIVGSIAAMFGQRLGFRMLRLGVQTSISLNLMNLLLHAFFAAPNPISGKGFLPFGARRYELLAGVFALVFQATLLSLLHSAHPRDSGTQNVNVNRKAHQDLTNEPVLPPDSTLLISNALS